MTLIKIDENVTNDTPIASWVSDYKIDDINIMIGIMQHDVSDTASVADMSNSFEEEIDAYEFMRSSGSLSFWDEPEEDIYSFEDGEGV